MSDAPELSTLQRDEARRTLREAVQAYDAADGDRIDAMIGVIWAARVYVDAVYGGGE